MLDPAIQNFLDKCKAVWLKSKVKPSTPDDEKQLLELDVNEKFLLSNWLIDMAKRASSSAISTHPNTFSHSKSTKHYPPNKNDKTSAIVANSQYKCDGFLRTGNSIVAMDTVRNAVTNNIAIDVYNFLALNLSDNKTIFEHLEQDTESIKNQLVCPNFTYDEIKSGLLAIKEDENKQKITSDLIKQVFFPVGKGYHLLSLLTSSGLLYELKNQLNDIRFSEKTKKSREDKKKNTFNETGFDEIYGLTAIGYGGTKPQNISVLNNKNGGIAYLLPSMPPVLNKQSTRIPKTNFFGNTLYFKNYTESFKSLEKLIQPDINNINIRLGIDNVIRFVISQVIEKSWALRQLDAGWSDKTNLKAHQKIWLDLGYQQQREDDTEWLDTLIKEFARWFIHSYEKVIGNNLINTEMLHIKTLIEEQKEGLL